MHALRTKKTPDTLNPETIPWAPPQASGVIEREPVCSDGGRSVEDLAFESLPPLFLGRPSFWHYTQPHV